MTTTIEEFYRSKADYVWWMLRDLIGDAALKKALSELINPIRIRISYTCRAWSQAQTQRDLQWFFDDWVYHDRGLPDFRSSLPSPARRSQGQLLGDDHSR